MNAINMVAVNKWIMFSSKWIGENNCVFFIHLKRLIRRKSRDRRFDMLFKMNENDKLITFLWTLHANHLKTAEITFRLFKGEKANILRFVLFHLIEWILLLAKNSISRIQASLYATQLITLTTQTAYLLQNQYEK